jgi:hypothetical protein
MVPGAKKFRVRQPGKEAAETLEKAVYKPTKKEI